MIDERDLTATLRELASGAVVGPEPAAAARRRADRIRRRRLAAAGAAMVVAVAVSVPLAVGSRSTSPRAPQPVYAAAERPTSAVVTVRSARSGEDTIRTVVYWHGGLVCQALVGGVGVAPASCAPPDRSRLTLGRPFGEWTVVGVVWSPRIRSVRLRYEDGTVVRARIASGRGFPHRVYASTLLNGYGVNDYGVVAVTGFDAGGHMVGDRSLDQARPQWPAGIEPASQVVSLGTTDAHTPGARETVVYWSGWQVCAVLTRPSAPVTDFGCVQERPEARGIIPGAVRGLLGGTNRFALCVGEGDTARVVATLDNGQTRVGRRVDGYGFPHPVFIFRAALEQEIVALDAYDAHGHRLGHARLFS